MASKAQNTRESMAAEAERRRNLEGNTLFKDLGEPIQKLLMQVSSEISAEKMKLFTKITVRQLAKVFDMLSLEEDPDKILAWLEREAMKAQGIEPAEKKKVKSKVVTGASRDAIAFYKELEEKNVALMEKFKKSQEEREQQRAENIAERRRRREEAQARLAAERERAKELGETVDAVERLKKRDVADIMNTFENFTKQSNFDNSNAAQDTEWWKKDEYRRDFEKFGPKGKLWTRVIEGGSQAIPEAEMAARMEWYRSQCWWKADKYRRDWLASREAEWWKEESYIRDWQEHGEKGRMWTAADEISGFNRKGDKRIAPKAELERRVQWYKDNGPKGIVKAWCALTEGSADRCTLEEKRERDDYFKNGDWWKSELFARKCREDPAACEALRCAGAAGEDREWWKDESYRKDFLKGGNLWKAASEKSAVLNGGDVAAAEAEAEKRAEWYSNNWWKSEKFTKDFQENGDKGVVWKALNEEESTKPRPKPCSAADLKVREAWFRSADDREWWKDEAFIRDWQENGSKGKKWTAAIKEAGIAAAADEAKAAEAEVKKRNEWYANNWWKADKFVKDFQANGSKGMAWKAAQPVGTEDKDWWKQGDYHKEWSAARQSRLTPFWQDPEYVEDYWKNGAAGKKWIAANAAAGSTNKGDAFQATPEELAEREAFYNANFWRSPEAQRDFAANGKAGKKWTAASPDSNERASAEEIRRRQEFFAPKWHNKANHGFASMLEADAESKLKAPLASPDEIAKRDAQLTKTWWQSPEVKEDYKLHGAKSKLLRAATQEVAALGLGDQPEFQASPEEIAARQKWFDSGASEGEWWADEAYRKEHAAGREPTFWKNPEYIEDYLKNGAAGKKWTAANAAAGSTGKGDKFKADAEELAAREVYLKKHFWQAPEYQRDFEQNGLKGTKWTYSEANGKGVPISDGDLKVREDFYKADARWKLAEKPAEKEKLIACAPAEALDREEWFEKNWWKSPEVKEDFKLHGAKSKLLRAATHDVAALGLGDQADFQASPEEIAARIEYFENCDNEWWKNPSVIADYAKFGDEGAVWQSRSLKDSKLSMGKEAPASSDELAERRQWFEDNYWKTPEAIEDFRLNGNKGMKWRNNRAGTAAVADAAELKKREEWLQAHTPVDAAEERRRKEWFQQQLDDEEKSMRRSWMVKNVEESKKIHVDELADALTVLNCGEKPSEEQLKAIEAAVHARRVELFGDEAAGDVDGITQEEFVTAVAETNFYVPATDEERLLAEQEALEALQQEEMIRLEEEAAFLAMEAEEEIKRAKEAAGDDYVDEAAAADEEAAALAAMEEAELAAAAHTNEDDVVDEGEEAAWQDFLNNKEAAEVEVTEEEAAELAKQEEERLAAEAALAEVNEAAWASEELGGEEGEEADGQATLNEEQKEDLEAVIEENEGWGEAEAEEWNNEEPAAEEIDEMQQEEKGQPMQWKLPLREVTNPQFLKSYFTVIKYTPSHSLLGGKQKRVWVVDHFTRCFYNLEKSGKIRKEHAANKLLQLERNILDATRLRLMFFDAAHSYELQFFNPSERERFYESASAIRPSIRVYAPDLTNQDASVEACTTTIDGVGPESVTVTCNNAAGKPVQRELTGECKINASKLLTEPLTIWTGTFNLSGQRPPRNPNELEQWMPKDKYDLYAVAVQEASFCKSESEWFEYVQQYLGKDYLTLASMNLWDTMLIVLTRKKHLLKITNVEGSTKATIHKAICGTKGGIGISLRFLETSICFVTCHLAARLERNQMRNTNLEEVIDCLQLGIRETDFCNQFNHVFFFGDFNYRVELDTDQADELIAAKDFAQLQEYDQLNQQRAEEGIMHGFQEPPITFAPTYRMTVGSDKYQAEKGNAPSYCDRVLTRSMANTWVKCTSYKAATAVTCSEHTPVSATFIVRCVRPVMSCFMRQQSPIPMFIFEEVNFIESTGPIIKRPALLINTPFTGIFKPIEAKQGSTATPYWSQADLPRLESVSQCQEYLETCHIILILREAAEKRDDKAHRGTALITLFGRVLNVQDVQQEFESDVMCHGKSIGKIVGKFHWEPAPLS